MVKANELRIGNLVGRYSNIMEVSGIGKERADLILVQPNTRVDWCMLYQDIFPIPLSEEILLKLGFNKSFRDFIATDGFFTLKKDGDQFFYRDYLPMSPSLEHLHQIQNLYFYLTGTELNISNLL